MKNAEINFTSEEYNTSNLDNGNEEIIKNRNILITLTTTKTQKNNYDNNINNLTSIYMGDCETLLREENGIPDDELLYMRKIDVYQDENSDMHLSYPVDISENEDIYNPGRDYYNNVCYPTTSNRGTDIILRDRQNEFI